MAVIETLEPETHDGIELDPRVAVLQDPESDTVLRGIASTAIVEEFQPRVYHCSYKILQSPLDAEESTQETFLKVFHKIDSYKPNRPFGRWVLKIAKNQAINMYRYRGRRPQLSELDDYTVDITSLHNHEGNFDENLVEDIEAHDHVKAMLEQITPAFAVPLAMRKLDDLDYETIARELDVPVGTVRSRIHRGKKELQRLLEE